MEYIFLSTVYNRKTASVKRNIIATRLAKYMDMQFYDNNSNDQQKQSETRKKQKQRK